MFSQLHIRNAIVAGSFVLGSILLFCGVAIVSLLLSANNSGSSLELLFDPYIWHIAGFTLYQAFLSTLLSVIGGIHLAIALHRRSDFPGRGLIIRLMLVPMRMPTLVIAFALIGIWGRQGLFNRGLTVFGVSEPVSIYGLSGILIAHVFFNMPLTAQVLLQGLDQVTAEYWRVSASLGMGPVSTFRFIEWPVFRRLLPGLCGLIFILCATSFTLILVLGGGPQATTLEVAIYQALHFDFDVSRAVVLSFLQIALTSFLLLFLTYFSVSADPGTGLGATAIRFDGRHALSKIWDWSIIALSALFICLPLGQIVWAGFAVNFPAMLSSALFWKALATSALLAIGSGLLAIVFAVLIVFCRYVLAHPLRHEKVGIVLKAGLSGVPSIVLLLPPVVLATGWFLVLPDPAHTNIAAPVLVIILNMLMALPFAVRMLEPDFQIHMHRVDRLAASLNIQGLWRLRFIDWPCLQSVILRALSLSMALSLGDLGAVALFGSDGFVTLPWLLFSKLGSYRTTDADGLALVIAVMCLGLASLGYGAKRQEEAR